MKAQQYREMSHDELEGQLEEFKRHLFDLRAQAVTGKLENSKAMRNVRRDIARIKTIARRRRQTVNEMLKKVIMGFVVGNYYSEEQVAELCELEPLAWRIAPRTIEAIPQIGKDDSSSLVSRESPKPLPDFYKVGRNDLCPCGSGKKYKKSRIKM